MERKEERSLLRDRIKERRRKIQETHEAALNILEAEEREVQPPQINGKLRSFALRVPTQIQKCSGIVIFGRRIRSLVFTTDIATIRNVDADAVLAVYPYTPQQIITEALVHSADIPIFAGVGGGLTQGKRVVNLATFAEMQGASGVVVNSPTKNEVIHELADTIDIPIIVTAVSAEGIDERVESGAAIINVAAGSQTPEVVAAIRKQFPELPIIATGGPTDESLEQTIAAGANAIVWTPPTPGEVFKEIMAAYRKGEAHP